MITETFEFTGYHGTVLPATIWQPEGTIKAVLQLTHGMTEHMGRYERLAAGLCSQGIAVAGFDLRGHGRNAGDPNIASFGEGGWDASLEDMHLFFGMLEGRFPGVPRYLLGFSLGSFLLREYLHKYPHGIAGAIIAGTGRQPGWILSLMRSIVKMQIKKAGYDQTTDLVRNLLFRTYNRNFKPNRTQSDWFCSDEAEVDQYLSDPLVRKDISVGLFYDLLGSMKRTGENCAYGSIPILLISGADDPVGAAGQGVQMIYSRMKQEGAKNATLRLYENARHALFHEEASGITETVISDICNWLFQCSGIG